MIALQKRLAIYKLLLLRPASRKCVGGSQPWIVLLIFVVDAIANILSLLVEPQAEGFSPAHYCSLS